jgi:hypothetical protein
MKEEAFAENRHDAEGGNSSSCLKILLDDLLVVRGHESIIHR